MLKRLLSLVLIAPLALSFGLSTPVSAAPPIQPMVFFGHVTVDGADTPGSTVSAHIDGLSWDTTVDGDSNYGYSPLLKIPYDDPETSEKDGGEDGDTIVFKVDGVAAEETYIYELGQGVKLDLHVGEISEDPYISLSPASFTFNAIEGGSDPSDKTLEIWNSGGGNLSWSVSDDAAWLSLSPTSGSSTGEVDDVDLSVDTSGLSDGVYNATITITGSGAINTPQQVPVTLNVSETAVPYLGFSPASFSFSATEGDSDPSDKTLKIYNSGGETLNWSVSDDAAWLSLSPTSGSSTGEDDEVAVSVDATGMEAQYSPYVATITISGNADNSPETVGVTVNVSLPSDSATVGGPGEMPDKAALLAPWIVGGAGIAFGLMWTIKRRRDRTQA